MISSESLDLFSWYLHERETVRLRKERGERPPWTSDPILSAYKFTNILRKNDKTTRWVKENWYDLNRDASPVLQVLNSAIFRYFGTTEYASEIGYQRTFNAEFLIDAANRRMASGQKVFTGAYIITNSGIKAPKQQVVVYNFLRPFWDACPKIVELCETTNSWQTVCKYLMNLPGLGAFMAKEVALDMMLNPVLEDCDDKLTWSPSGPGAIRGLNRLHGRPVDKVLSQDNALAEMKDILQQLSLQKKFANWMPKIGVDYGVTDVQFSLCEIDKYLRVKLGEGRPRSKYRAI